MRRWTTCIGVGLLLTVQVLVSGQGRQGATPGRPATPAAPAVEARALTNADIVSMVQAGLGETVVLATIRTATARAFDVTPTGLIDLKKNGVSDAIVALMIDPAGTLAPTVQSAPVAAPILPGMPAIDTRARIDSSSASPEIPREPGIYWDKGHDGAHNLIALEPTVFSQAKSGGFLTSALTYGIKKINWKAVSRGSAAGMKVTETSPTFYFYFESKGGLSAGGFAGWLAGATSPNEFVLARMTSKARERELIVAEFGALGGNSGARSKDTIDIEIERLSAGVYRVKPSRPLEPGEYCFFYAGGIGTLGMPGGGPGGGKLFDFGIYDDLDR